MADNVWHRIGNAVDVFRHGQKRVVPSERKQAPYVFPPLALGRPSWIMSSAYESFVSEGFNKNALIYACIMYKARAISSAPLKAYKGDRANPEDVDLDDALAQLIARPNPFQSWYEFQALNTVYLNVSGNCYICIDRPKKDSWEGAALWPLRPDRVFPVTGKVRNQFAVTGYAYVPEGKTPDNAIGLLPDKVMHVKLPNPGDPYEGMGQGLSPFNSLAWSAEVDNEITRFLKIFFERGMMPPIAIKYDMALDEVTAEQIKERAMEIYGGTDGMMEPMILDQSGSIEKLGYSFNDLGFEAIDNRNESRVMMPFGVPPVLVGSRYGMERSTFANYAESRQAFWQDTMIPELKMFQDEYQYYLQGVAGEWVEFDLSEVPALQKNIPELVAAAKILFDMGIPANTALDSVGLTVEETPGGDISYLPFGLAPVGMSEPEGEGTEEAITAETDERGQKSIMLEEQKLLHWKAVDKIARSWEAPYAKAARKQFGEDKKHVLAALSEGKSKAIENKATPDWKAIGAVVRKYFDGKAKTGWNDAFEPLILGTAIDQGERWGKVLGTTVNRDQLRASEWFKTYTLKFADPITQTSSDQIAEMLAQAQAEGWSIPKAQDGLDTMFKQWVAGDVSPEDWEFATQRLPAYRTEAIARTETIRSSMGASNELYKEWGVEQKEWLISPGACDLCVALGETVIGTKEKFGDIEGPPLHPNCRCTLIPVIS